MLDQSKLEKKSDVAEQASFQSSECYMCACLYLDLLQEGGGRANTLQLLSVPVPVVLECSPAYQHSG